MASPVSDVAFTWSQRTLGTVALGDPRRTARAVEIGAALARNPQASIPRQAGCPHQAKAAYRFFDMPQVTTESLCLPHWRQTREKASAAGTALLIQDTTSMAFSGRGEEEGMGPISTFGQEQGLHLHSVLAVVPGEEPEEAEVLGLAHQTIYARIPAPEGETQAERQRRRCESDRWPEAMEEVGGPASGARLVHVADREADCFGVFAAAARLGVDVLIRAAGSAAMRGASLGHAVEAVDREPFAPMVRRLPPQGEARRLRVRAAQTRPARVASLRVAFAPVTLHAPNVAPAGTAPQALHVVRVHEPDPPAGTEPKDVVEWILLTSCAVEDEAAAWRMAMWYRHRWLVEEYHKCLKSGCSVEKRQLETAERLEPLVAMLCLVACMLLQGKFLARRKDSPPALEAAPREHVELLALHRGKDAKAWSCRDFWREVAKLGGFMGRRGDGDPGWLTTWRGWLELDMMVAGARLVRDRRAPPRTCG